MASQCSNSKNFMLYNPPLLSTYATAIKVDEFERSDAKGKLIRRLLQTLVVIKIGTHQDLNCDYYFGLRNICFNKTGGKD